jgi:DNA polymerase-3 subunit delta'
VLFEKITGHIHPKRVLSKAVESGEPFHSYLFWGPEGVGKKSLALRFAQALACPNRIDGCGCNSCKEAELGIHPDIHLILPQGESLKISGTRALIELSSLHPLKSPFVVNILEEADRLTPEAANSILKLLEEPPPAVVNILITSRPHFLPPTVLSRCLPISFGFLKMEEIKDELQKVKAGEIGTISRIAGGRIGEALHWAKPENWKRRLKYLSTGFQLAAGNVSLSQVDNLFKEKDKNGVMDFLKVLLSLWRDLSLVSLGLEEVANLDQFKNIQSLSGERPAEEWVKGCFLIEEVLELSYTTVNMNMLITSLVINLSMKKLKERRDPFAA